MGRLAIPYLDRLGVCGFTFRCLSDHDCKEVNCPKYLQLKDQDVGFFNVLALSDSTSDVAHVCEGEIDVMTLTQVFPDQPVAGLSGANKWEPYYTFHLQGFDTVYVWSDGDAAGDKMRARICDALRNAEPVQIPAGMDVNSLYCTKGPNWIRTLVEDGGDDAGVD